MCFLPLWKVASSRINRVCFSLLLCHCYPGTNIPSDTLSVSSQSSYQWFYLLFGISWGFFARVCVHSRVHAHMFSLKRSWPFNSIFQSVKRVSCWGTWDRLGWHTCDTSLSSYFVSVFTCIGGNAQYTGVTIITFIECLLCPRQYSEDFPYTHLFNPCNNCRQKVLLLASFYR